MLGYTALSRNYQTIQEPICKKIGEIHLCVDYWKLNSIVVRNAFPLPWIDEALQVSHNCHRFISFDLVQGYLQMPV